MVPSATENPQPLPPEAVIEIPNGNLLGREVLYRRRCCISCVANAGLAWKMLAVTLLLGAAFVGAGIVNGYTRHDWNGSSVLFVSAGVFVAIGLIYFATVHPKGC